MAIKISKTSKKLSSHAGITITAEMLKSFKFRELVDASLPKLKGGTARSYKKLTDLLQGLVCGADCLDDMGILETDEGFLGVCQEKVYSPKAYGDFLRQFNGEQIHKLQKNLMQQGFELHRRLFPEDKLFFFDMDSTENIQYGKKMEGVRKNYKHNLSLDSLDVFDGNGIQYFIDVRPGATHTSLGCEDVIHRLCATKEEYDRKWDRKTKVCFRGDRGYYKSSFMNACHAENADFILGVVQDQHHFPQILGQIHNWRESFPDDPERIKFTGDRDIEIGSTVYRPADCQRRLRYVVIRAKKSNFSPLFPGHQEYDYMGFATTYSEQLMDDEDIVLCYRERGNAENFVKENKNGLDMKHYPCLKLNANRAYALICAFAYNHMRFMALADNPEKAVLSKKIRFRWINLPSLVARTGGDVYIKLMQHHYTEVTRWFKLIHNLQLEFA